MEQLISDKLRELSWPVRIRLACDVAKGLKYVHSRGIMHRDLTSKVCIAHRACAKPILCSQEWLSGGSLTWVGASLIC